MSLSGKKMRSGGDSFRRLGLPGVTLAVCFCALLAAAAQAQTATQEEKSDGSALELKLSAYESRVCQRSSLTLMLEMTNSSRQQLKIHRLSLWSQFSFSRVGTQMGGSSISCGVDDGKGENWIVLGPGEKYQDTFNYRLEYNSFFQDAGHYKLSTSLGYNVADKYGRTAASTEVEFEVYDCAAK